MMFMGKLGGGFKYIFCYFHPPDPWENDPNLTIIFFSNGLVQPPISKAFMAKLSVGPWVLVIYVIYVGKNLNMRR